MVVTEWQWGLSNSYLHDEVATDKRNPTLYPYGQVYAVDFAQDFLWALDPKSNRVTSYKVPTTNVNDEGRLVPNAKSGHPKSHDGR